MAPFEPCSLKSGQDGDPTVFFGKTTGYGYNDMISLPTLTKDSILENLKRRFKVSAGCHKPYPTVSGLCLTAGKSKQRPRTLMRPLACPVCLLADRGCVHICG